MIKHRLVLDILERVVWTFVQGAVSTLLLTGFLDVEAWKAAVVGGVAAVLALVKGFAASQIGSPASAATLPNTVTDVGTIAGELTGQVVGTSGEIIGEIVGEAVGVTDEAKSLLKKPAKRVAKTTRKRT